MDDSAVCAAGPGVLLLFVVQHVRGYGRLLPVSLSLYTSEAKRPAKGFVAGLVTITKKYSVTDCCRNCVAAGARGVAVLDRIS
jgi:hypothetical protein